LELKWYFGPGGSEDQGPKDSIELLFKGNKYYSIAREAIQNSLDAVLDKSKPVVVKFNLFEINKSDLPTFFELKGALEKCLEYYKDDTHAQKILNNSINAIKHEKLTCLRISDYNTIGLEYTPGKSPFYAFMQAVGVNIKKSTGSGGSFGFGKGAYYAASAFKSIVISSIYNEDKFIFQGKARLTTHIDNSGNKKDYVGKFGINDGEPVLDQMLVPTKLRRTEKGTDIIIMGFNNEDGWKDSLIKSVLNNFWLAIWDNKLDVEVEDVIINEDNLESIISKYYSESDIDGTVSETETWNPYPYFKAVKYQTGPNAKCFEKELPTLGVVKLFLLLKDKLPNRTVYSRSPKMMVFKKTDNRGFNYVGVFVCDSEKGNRILKEMENPQHNEWKKNNYLDNDKPHKEGKLAEEELKKFMRDSLESLMKTESNKPQRILGLEEFLSIPEDLLPDDEGEGESIGSGEVNPESSKEETSVESTIIEEAPATFKLSVTNKGKIIEDSTGEKDEAGEEIILTGMEGGDSPSEPDEMAGEIAGRKSEMGNLIGQKEIKTPLKVRYRLIARSNANNNIEHILKIFTDKDTTGELEIFSGLDNDTSSEDSLLKIQNASFDSAELKWDNNRIYNIPFRNGENIINIMFDDNQKHSIRLRAYEL
jgi:hypothetical protein